MRFTRNFVKFASADAVTQLGTQITLVALPLTAMLTLDAGAFELGLLTAAEMVPFLLIGLPVGVWVDRMRRRPMLVWTDLIRGAALLTIPVAAWLGGLTLVHLYAVALIVGFCTVFFDVAHMSFLPSVVTKDQLERGNSVLMGAGTIATLAGPGLGGALVNLLTAPIALLADAISYLASGLLLWRVRAQEATPAPAQERRRLRQEVMEGIRYVSADPALRVIAVLGALAQLANGIWNVGQPLYLIKELGLSPGVYGLLISVSVAGSLIGAAIAPRVTARYGTGRAIAGSALVTALLYAPVAWTGAGWQLYLFPVFLFLAGVPSVVLGIAQLSYRQRTTPEHLLGRVNASMRFLMWSALPLGGLIGGALGEWSSGRTVFVTGVIVTVVAHVPAIISRGIRRLEPAGAR